MPCGWWRLETCTPTFFSSRLCFFTSRRLFSLSCSMWPIRLCLRKCTAGGLCHRTRRPRAGVSGGLAPLAPAAPPPPPPPPPPARTRLFDRTFWLGSAGIGAASLIGFVLGTSYAVLDFSRFFWHGIACEWNHYSTGHPGQEGTANHWWYLRNTFFHILGPSLSIPALVGLVRSLLRPTRQGCVLLSFPLLYFLFVSSFSARRTWCSLSSNQLLTRSGFTRSFTSVL